MAYLPQQREWRALLHGLRERLPVNCLLCQARTPGGLCASCQQAVYASMNPGGRRCSVCDLALAGSAGPGGACPDCAALSPAFDRVVAAFDYAWPGELLIHRFKREGRLACAPVLARLMAERCRRTYGWIPAGQGLAHDALVVAVPASRHSLALRGFNPSAELGRELAHRLRLDWQPGLLQRMRDGPHQKSLGRRSRLRSVAGLYRCAGVVAGRNVLVVDDVMTTGSTLNAIARALKAGGATKVWGVVAARTPAVASGGVRMPVTRASAAPQGHSLRRGWHHPDVLPHTVPHWPGFAGHPGEWRSPPWNAG